MKKILFLCISLSCLALVKAQLVNNGSITVSGNALISLQDCDWVNNGTFEAGTGEVLMNGNMASSISGTVSAAFYNLTIGKSAGTGINLLTDIAINNMLNFQGGLLDLNGKNILLASTASLTNENENSRITGPAGGFVEIIQSLNAPASAGPGNLGAIITSSQNLGTTIIRRGHQSQTSVIGGGSSILRYYDIIPTNNASLDAILRFQYFDAELNGLTESDLELWKKPSGSGWTPMGYDSKNTTTNYVEKSGIADFSRWTLSTPGNALPVVWGSISVSCANDDAVIRFQTLQEWNTLRFDIERSGDGRTWANVATLNAAGNSAAPTNYVYTDHQPGAYSSYYRIAQVDVDGRKKYSQVIAGRCGNATNDMLAYPNPAGHLLWVSISSSSAGRCSLQLYDAKGTLVKQQTTPLQIGTNLIQLSLENLTAGTYLLSATNLELNWKKQLKIVRL
jgi:type IX secretion system substrate protein